MMRRGRSTLVSKSESTASSASTDDKTTPPNIKLGTSLASNTALAYYGQSHGYNQIGHVLSNIHGLYRCSCNLLDVHVSGYSLNLENLTGCFSYEWSTLVTRPFTRKGGVNVRERRVW